MRRLVWRLILAGVSRVTRIFVGCLMRGPRLSVSGVWPSKIEKRHGSGWKDMGLNGSLSGQM